MADFVIRVGSRSAQGARANNEDAFVVDAANHLYLVADGMGGQDHGEVASGLAAQIIPRAVQDCLRDRDDADFAMQHALIEANQAIIDAGQNQPEGKRMGTTAVFALERSGKLYVAAIGDSRAYLIRESRVEQLTVDHSVAQALVANGVLTPEEARCSPMQHVLYKFLGCANMPEGTEIRPLEPKAGDRLLLASDGLTNHISEDDLRDGGKGFPDMQAWTDSLVATALDRGSLDNVTCIIVAFDLE